MPRKARELSSLEIKRLKSLGRYAVGGVDSLFLRVTTTGSRQWLLRYPTGEKRLSSNGKMFAVYRDLGLGGYPSVSLARAREKARLVREELENGIDPVTKKREIKRQALARELRSITFQKAAEAVIRVKQAEAGNLKHAKQWQSSLETYVFPILGDMAVADITLVHIKQALEPIWKTKTVTASRVQQRIESVLAWATVHGHREGDNPARWKGHLDAVLPAPTKIKKKVHHRAMPIDGLPEFWMRLRERKATPAKALAFTILTRCRAGDVLGARWEEFDLAAATWTISSERMKNRRRHRVPLAPAAVEFLRSLPEAEEGLVFTRDGGRKLSDRAMTDLLAKRARVMKQWAAFLATPASASDKKVTAIRKAATE